MKHQPVLTRTIHRLGLVLVMVFGLTVTLPTSAVAGPIGDAANNLTKKAGDHLGQGAVMGIVAAAEGLIEGGMHIVDWIIGLFSRVDGGGIDENYFDPATTARIVVQPSGEVGPIPDAADAAAVSVARTVERLRLIRSTVAKYNGARRAGDIDMAEARRREAVRYLDMLDVNLDELAVSMMALHEAVQGTPAAEGEDTLDEILEHRAQVLRHGFPEFEQPLLEQLQVTDEELEGMIFGSVRDATGETLTPALLSNETVLAATARLVSKIDVRASLPSEFKSPCADPRTGRPVLGESGGRGR
ncbi:MAG: hypothetical protein AAF533_00780 [Acidobacteriota bacterium]